MVSASLPPAPEGGARQSQEVVKSYLEVAPQILDQGLIPIFNSPDIEVAKRVCEACIKAGSTVFEITNRGDNVEAVFRALVDEYSDQITLGVGSVLTTTDAEFFIDIGAKFIVSPVNDPEVLETCRSRGILYIGAGQSPQRIFDAYKDARRAYPDLDVPLTKLYHAGKSLDEPSDLAEVMAPFVNLDPPINIIPTGGVRIHDAKKWFQAGAKALGLSGIFDKNDINDGRWDAVESRVNSGLRKVETAKIGD